MELAYKAISGFRAFSQGTCNNILALSTTPRLQTFQLHFWNAIKHDIECDDMAAEALMFVGISG